jgi:hypothetical protein
VNSEYATTTVNGWNSTDPSPSPSSAAGQLQLTSSASSSSSFSQLSSPEDVTLTNLFRQTLLSTDDSFGGIDVEPELNETVGEPLIEESPTSQRFVLASDHVDFDRGADGYVDDTERRVLMRSPDLMSLLSDLESSSAAETSDVRTPNSNGKADA